MKNILNMLHQSRKTISRPLPTLCNQDRTTACPGQNPSNDGNKVSASLFSGRQGEVEIVLAASVRTLGTLQVQSS